ncbi:restriction endonuclease subunit S [Aeribacillus sp. FSL K6-8210]|uniref:restriction endonuclease subunit S n=1 Tax=unclassified Aeribacillus TaxID=2640495 RepID=UPI0030CF8E6B
MTVTLKRLGDIATYVNGYAFKPTDWKNKGLPIIRIQNLTNPDSPFNYYQGEIDDKYIVNKGDILISWSASLGVFEWLGEKAVLNQHIFKVIFDKEDIDKSYFKYIVQRSLERALKYLHGSTMKHITKKYFDNILVPIPDLVTQKKIAKVLDKAQELIDKRKAQIEALDQLTQSVFLEMFGDPIKNTNQYKKEKLANLCIKITDGTHHSPPTVKEGIPYITAKHLNKGGLDFFKDPTYVSLEDHQKIYERCNPEKGDVLYIKDGATTGIAAINHYDFEFSMLSSLALIKVDFNKLNNYYLTHFLNNERVFRKITSGMNGGAIKRLTLKKINNIEVVVPPIELQNQFAEIIKKIEIQKELLQKSLEELENNFNSLMQRVFKGELFND